MALPHGRHHCTRPSCLPAALPALPTCAPLCRPSSGTGAAHGMCTTTAVSLTFKSKRHRPPQCPAGPPRRWPVHGPGTCAAAVCRLPAGVYPADLTGSGEGMQVIAAGVFACIHACLQMEECNATSTAFGCLRHGRVNVVCDAGFGPAHAPGGNRSCAESYSCNIQQELQTCGDQTHAAPRRAACSCCANTCTHITPQFPH